MNVFIGSWLSRHHRKIDQCINKFIFRNKTSIMQNIKRSVAPAVGSMKEHAKSVHKSAHHGLAKKSSSSENNAENPRTPPVSTARKFNQTFTLTFGDMAENHVGMQKIGKLAESGFSMVDLQRAKSWFEAQNCECIMSNLKALLSTEKQNEATDAYILVVKGGVNGILGYSEGANDFFNEQRVLPKDSKAFMYGRVVNKHARHNLCFSEESQEPKYEDGKGRIVSFAEVPILKAVRDKLPEVVGDAAAGLAVEGNYYFDLAKCGIGYHGDAERKKVMGVRLGESMLLCFAWYQDSTPISRRLDINLSHGDLYFMSEKTTGCDWKMRSIPTLRHAAGAKKFIKLPDV